MAIWLLKTVHMDAEQTSFLMPLGEGLDPKNRWVRMARLVPWHMVEQEYGRLFRRDRGGQLPLTARVALGALIVKERLGLTDRETVEQIRENPYIQYFLGYASFSNAAPFDSSLMVHFRKRLGAELVTAMNQNIIESRVRSENSGADVANGADDDEGGPGASPSQPTFYEDESSSCTADSQGEDLHPVNPDGCVGGAMIIDATCAPADITHPTDLKVVNQAREATERIIDELHRAHAGTRRRPRTHRKKARQAFVSSMKSKKMNRAARHRAVGKQLRYLRRNLRIIDRHVAASMWDLRQLPLAWYKKLLVAAEVARQQTHLYRTRDRSIPDRIVSLSQPHVRPIVRGKAGVPVEFGAKLSASHIDGYASLDRISWDAFHEGRDLPTQAEGYRARTGRYPAVIHADRAYTTRANRAWCKQHGIRLSGLAPGRPPTDPEALRARRRQVRDDESARQPIEGIFGRAKRRWSLQRIMAKLAGTSATVIALVFLVMNLEAILLPICILALVWCLAGMAWQSISRHFPGISALSTFRLAWTGH